MVAPLPLNESLTISLPRMTASVLSNDASKSPLKDFCIVSVRMNVPLTIETPMTTANAVSSARILRPARPLSATPIIVRSPARASRGSRARVERPRSRTMSPSARNSTRSAIAAACASCVTITVVWPSVSTESRSSARISPLVVESRLPVGSSANITLGPRDERAGDGDALLLAAGELRRAVRRGAR